MNLSSSPFTIAIVKLLQAQSILQESLSTLVRTGSQQTGCAGAILYQFGLPGLKSRFPTQSPPDARSCLPADARDDDPDGPQRRARRDRRRRAGLPGQTIVKGNAKKVRRLAKGSVIGGFAGATADAFTLFERLEAKLEQYPGQLTRACVELTKDWRTDRYLRRLEAMMLVADKEIGLLLSGAGDVIEPERRGRDAIGSGGNFALAAARALADADSTPRRSCAAPSPSRRRSASTPTPTWWWRAWRHERRERRLRLPPDDGSRHADGATMA